MDDTMSGNVTRARPPVSMQRRRIELCTSAAIGAIVLGVSTAGAQSYNAPHVSDPSYVFINDSPGVTDVSMNSTSAVIQWNVPGGTGTYDFQTSGTTTFHYFTDFTVLNVVNIDPSRAIKFNGVTNSLVGSAPGGNVWFYSPGGIIVGSTATFNVGSLMLSTSSPANQTDGFDPSSVSLTGASNSASSIVVESGASITASNYVAMVAPHIDQGGTVRAGGEIAYVAAEAADLTFPVGSGLFSIDIPTGTDAVNAQGQVLVHTGTSGGPGATSGTTDRNIYFVAMPKNTAITTLLGGTIGYDPADVTATNFEGTVVVGHGIIINGNPYQDNDFTSLPGYLDEIPGNVTIASGASFLQDVTAFGTNITTQALTGDISFAKSATLQATLTNILDVATGHQITTGGSLFLRAQGRDPNFSDIGGTVTATVNGRLQVGSGPTASTGLSVDARSSGTSESDSTGGSATLSIIGGTVEAGTNGITVNADGTGGEGSSNQGGAGVGGTALLALQGTMNTGGSVTVSAVGTGGDSSFSVAGNGSGGSASLIAQPGGGVTTPILNANAINVYADGTGGLGFCNSCSPVGAVGGAGTGGSAILSTTDTNVTTSSIGLTAYGSGGNSDGNVFPGLSGPGGDGTGGLASATFIHGTVSASNISAYADGSGGGGGDAITDGSTSGDGGRGGNGTGGLASGGKGASVTFAGSTLTAGEGTGIIVSAVGTGGDGGSSDNGFGGNGGTGTGGDASFLQSFAANIPAGVSLLAYADGGFGGSAGTDSHQSVGGDAIGGRASFTATGGIFNGDIDLTAYGEFGEGSGGPNDGIGYHGSLQGGNASVSIDNAAVTLSTLIVQNQVDTGNEGGQQYHGAFASGGNASISVSGNGSLSIADLLSLNTSAAEMGGDTGAGDGEAGAITIQTMTGGSISSASTNLTANGFGGFGGSGTGGDGQGGTILIQADNGAITLGSVTIDAGGGAGSQSGGGRTGFGGSVTINAQNGGTFDAAGGLSIDARGTTFDDLETATGGTVALTANGGQITIGGLTALSSGNLQSNLGSSSGGSISILATGNPATSGSSSFGNTILQAAGDTTSGTVSITNNISSGVRPLSFGSLDINAAGPTATQAISIASLASAITADSATLNTNGGIVFSASNNGTFSVTNDLQANSDLFIQVNGTATVTPTIQANSLVFNTNTFNALGTTILKATTDISIDIPGPVTAGTLTAGNSIFVSTPGDIALGSAIVTDPAQLLSGALDTTKSFISLRAGYSSGSPVGTGNLTVFNAANARGYLDLRATRDVTIGAGATVRSDNALAILAGDDITIGAGATVAGAANPIDATTGFTNLNAGDGTGPVEVHSLINAGTITGTGALLTVRADAIQSTGTLGGAAITAYLNPGAQTGNDGGTLTASCTGGNLCIGAIAATGAVNIGTQGRTPTVSRIAGNVTAASLDVQSTGGIFLGGGTPSTMTITGLANFNAGTQSLNDLGTVGIQAGSIAISATNDIAASATSFQSTGDITLAVGRNIFAADLIAGGNLGSGHIALTGQLNVSGRIAAGTGGIDFTAPVGITLNRVTLGNGTSLTLDSGTAALTITDASPNAGARAGVVSLHGGAITVGRLASTGTVGLAGSGLVQVTTDLDAGGAVTASGPGIALTSLAGPLTVASANSTANLALTSGGALTLVSGSAAGTTTLAAGAGGLTVNNSSSGGAFTANSSGPIDYGSITASQATLNATGGIAIGTLNVGSGGTAALTAGGAITGTGQFTAGGGLSLTGGSINLTTPGALTLASVQTTAGNLTLNPGGGLSINSGSATGNVTINGPGTVGIGSLTAGGNMLITAPSGLTFNLLSGNNVSLSASGGVINGAQLLAGGTVGLSAGGAVNITTNLAAAGAVTATGSGISLVSTSSVPLNLSSASTTGSTVLNVGSGGLVIGTSTSGSGFTATSTSNIDYSSISAFQASLTATNNINGGSLNTSGGPATLMAGGAIVTNGALQGNGGLTVTGGSVSLTTAASLTLASVQATAGDLTLNPGGTLTINSGSATGNATINGTGAASIGTLTAGGDMVITAPSGINFSQLSGNNVTLGTSGAMINGARLTAAGAVGLSAAGDVNITTDLAATGPVTVSGGIISLVSPSRSLNVASATSSVRISLFSDNALTLASGTSSGTTLLSAGVGGLTVGTSTSGSSFTATSSGNIDYNSISATQATLTATGNIQGGQLVVTGSGTATFMAGGAIVNNGQLSAGGGLSVTGASVNLTTPGALNLALVRATAGDVTLTPTGALTVASGIASGKGTINGGADVTLTSFTTGGDLTVTTPGAISFGSLTSNNNIFLTSQSGMVSGSRLTTANSASLTAATGVQIIDDLTAPGGISLMGPSVVLTSLGSLNITSAVATSATVDLRAAGNLIVQRATAPGGITLVSDSGRITAGTIASTGQVTLTATTGIGFQNIAGTTATLRTTNGDISGGAMSIAGKATLQAGNAIRLTGAVATGTGSTSGNLALAGANDTLGNGGDLVVSGTADISIDNAVVGGRALLTGSRAAIGSLRSGGDLSIVTPGDIGFVSLAGNGVTLTSSAGSVSGQTLAASYTTNLSASSLLQVTGLTSADVVTASGRTINLVGPGALTLASINSAGAATVVANGLTINGAVQGTSIDLQSQSIAIGSTARIGTAGTTTGVTFRNTGTGRSFIASAGTGYSLSAAALGRVQADAITIVLPQASGSSAAVPDVVIGDLTVHGSTGTANGTLANLTSNGSFTVRTAGRIQVAGKLQLTDIGAGNAATLSAGTAIDVVTPSGQVLVTDTAGNAQGTLTFISPRITVASASAIADLASTTTLAQRETRLARNDGAVLDQGYIVSGHLVFNVVDALYVQNTGGIAPTDRRGVTAGTGGIDLAAIGTASPEIILNGRQAAADNTTFTAGFDLVPLIHFSALSSGVSARTASAINGCISTSCSTPTNFMEMVPPLQDTETMLDEVEDEESAAQTLPDATRPLIATTETSPFSFAPVVDEPVVGIGTETVGFGTGDTGGTGSVPQNGSISTGPESGNTAGVPQNGNISTGPANGDTAGVPQNGNISTGPANGDTTGVPQNGAPASGSANSGGTNGVPQNGNISTGPASTERGTTTPPQR
jgi:filamentous hemagglutinin family protein